MNSGGINLQVPRKKTNYQLKKYPGDLFRVVTMALSFDSVGQSMVVFKSVSKGSIFTIPLVSWNEYFEMVS